MKVRTDGAGYSTVGATQAGAMQRCLCSSLLGEHLCDPCCSCPTMVQALLFMLCLQLPCGYVAGTTCPTASAPGRQLPRDARLEFPARFCQSLASSTFSSPNVRGLGSLAHAATALQPDLQSPARIPHRLRQCTSPHWLAARWAPRGLANALCSKFVPV